MTLRSTLPACLLLLAGCGDFRMEKEALTARTTGPAPMGPDCASCHAYPLKDTNHVFHLFETGDSKDINGPVTCFDCHSTAVAKRPFVIRDSIFIDSLDNQWSSWDFPVDPAGPTVADTIRTYRLDRIDTVAQERPVPAPARPGARPEWEEYITSIAHMNGKVDVVFADRVSHPTKWGGAKAAWLPEKETCSAVACHPNPGQHWRFAAPGKGLPALEGRLGEAP